jgi:hypothetical protein
VSLPVTLTNQDQTQSNEENNMKHRAEGAAALLYRRLFHLLLPGLLILLASGCISLYVPASEMRKVAQPAPIQVLFEFQTKGVGNSRVTEMLKPKLLEHVKASGLFSEVGDQAVASGALLGITIDNVPITSQDDAAAKGFVTGFTFGLVGNQVTDGYVCTLKYSGGVQQPNIEKTARHAIHGVIGAKGAPPNATLAESAEAAVFTMVRQIVANALRDLSFDPAFK